jgi:large subunit ribosomal protein L29
VKRESIMKASELRSMTREELDHELRELREEEFRLRLRRPTEELPNALRLRAIRHDIARIQTILREDKLGLISLPKKSQKEPEKKAPAEKPTAKKQTSTASETSAPRKGAAKSKSVKRSREKEK